MNKPKFESPDLTAQNIDRIAALFPNCVTEMLDEERSTKEKKVYKRAIDFELLKQMLSPDVVDGDEAERAAAPLLVGDVADPGAPDDMVAFAQRRPCGSVHCRRQARPESATPVLRGIRA